MDPREQLAAQRWARLRSAAVLAVAHTHPHSSPMPSQRDRSHGVASGLMLIGGGNREQRAWWLDADRRTSSVPIEVGDTQDPSGPDPL